MDGPHFRQDLPEITGPRPPFLGTTAHTLIADKNGPNLTILGPIRMRCVIGAKNGVSLAAIRVRGGVFW